MSLTEAIWKFRLNAFDFRGRTSRRDFWFQFLIGLAVMLLVKAVGMLAGLSEQYDEYGSFAWNVYTISLLASMFLPAVIFIPLCALVFRRLHDTGRSVSETSRLIVPFVAFYLLAQPGEVGPNRFGPPPHAPPK